MVMLGSELVAAALAVTALVLFGAAGLTYRRHTGGQGIALASLLASGGVAAIARSVDYFWEIGDVAVVLTEAPIVVYVVAWFVFALEYSGYDRFLNWRTVGVVVVGSVFVTVMSIVNVLGNVSDTLFVLGMLGYMVVMGAMFAGTTFVLVGLVRYEYVDTPSALVLTLGIVSVPFLPLITSGTATNQMHGELLTLSVLTAGYLAAIHRGSLFDVTPAPGTIGRIATFDDVRDAVIVIDEGNRIADMNGAAEWALSTSIEEVGGRPLSVLFENHAEALSEPGKTEFVYETPAGRRHFEATVSPVTGDDGQRVGKTLVVRDVTDRVTREQQIEVLNRVLRHNLRNRATNVMLTAELVADGEEPPGRATDIVDAMEDLLSVSEKARDLEDALGQDGGDGRTTLRGIVDDVADRLREEYEDAEVVIVDTPAVNVTANPRVVELVLWHLGTNAVEHNDADDPRVELSGAVSDARIEFQVADNGPGIPEHDREVIESGAETPLEHSTGIGLWCISWIVTHNGGELNLEDNEPRGTVARVSLPLKDGPARPTSGARASTRRDDTDQPMRERTASPFERLVHFWRSHSERWT